VVVCYVHASELANNNLQQVCARCRDKDESELETLAPASEILEWVRTVYSYLLVWLFQMLMVYSPLTWGVYTEPPPDIPECGFVGELCPPPILGR